ncbi:hypothetical protein P153DRAFT_398735 [Dothidotthia symphoricarpi CBS 119687]|uniref:Uncharacterized protein n=1 Tax=Dothidotthia symphoricarpi CBS 119687 TaxID=1392245 RepID=A0A6A6A868_9PLEO|nr:uncharacterized protein P153DRAFT_398735 [Dothidotthia symphoricarpi CBS 119687]KAF2127395.1 hypothetical protein P153DRAFT_398735 [Dothidotthia symphoricarpi CBS 119687]
MEVDMCDDCIMKAYLFQAGSPINGRYALQSNHSSLTASWSKTGFPLARSTTPFAGASPRNTTSEKCDGKTYSIKSGDTSTHQVVDAFPARKENQKGLFLGHEWRESASPGTSAYPGQVGLRGSCHGVGDFVGGIGKLDGAIKGCIEYGTIVTPMTCQSFMDSNGITMARFFNMFVRVRFPMGGLM